MLDMNGRFTTRIRTGKELAELLARYRDGLVSDLDGSIELDAQIRRLQRSADSNFDPEAAAWLAGRYLALAGLSDQTDIADLLTAVTRHARNANERRGGGEHRTLAAIEAHQGD